MPLALGTGPVVDTGGLPVLPPPAAYALPELSWFDPGGTEWVLTDTRRVPLGGPGYFMPSPGPTGVWDAAEVEYVVDKSERGGRIVRHAAPAERLIILPVYVEGTSFVDLDDRWRALGLALTRTSRRGPGTFVVTRPTGEQRAIKAYYDGGWKATPELHSRWDTCVVTMLCPDPYWRAPTPTPILRRGGSPGRSFLKRFPRVSTSQTIGATPVTNPGDVEAWPYWVLTGPLGLVTARNQRRNEQWTINAATYLGRNLDVGEVITINTETGLITGPQGPDGTDWAGALDWTQSVLWRLDEGNSDVDFVVTGQTSDTKIEASFYARYEMA